MTILNEMVRAGGMGRIGGLARALVRQGNAMEAVRLLICRWNLLASPRVLRTDDEHAQARRLARAIDARLRTASLRRYWDEDEDGRKTLA